MMRFFYALLTLCFSLSLQAEGGYKISVSVEGFAEQEAYLGYHFGDKQYIQDTVKVSNGDFVFEGDEPLAGGLYLIILPPDNNYFQIIVNDQEQQFSVKTKVDDLNQALVVKGSADNELFLNYLGYLGSRRPQADALSAKIREANENGDEAAQKQYQEELEKINAEVLDFQQKLIADHPQSLTAAIIRANLSLDIPQFEGKDADLQHCLYTKQHFFDNIDNADPRVLRSPVQFSKVDYYIQKLTVQHPDSLIRSIDYVLDLVKPSEETFKFYLIHFLNTYAKSKIIGMDAIYVHLVEKYYATGMAPWTEEEQLTNIVDNAKTLKPLLIGKTAPDLNCRVFDLEGSLTVKDSENIHQRFKTKGKKALHEVEADYTILFIWAPDCGHCKKAMPKMIEFYNKFKPEGVEIYAICSKFVNGIPECTSFIDERRGMLDWINVIDPYHESKYKEIYDVRSTPQLYVLDKNKEIVLKRIGTEQLPEVMRDLIDRAKELED